ncbi:hypothetical protein [Xenorhabdus thuongxuanensis]|uniref:Inverse autotransporter beta-barrel domain-containing protein n=1 Tax=Xenorhabdus thuongxuanensis TaxID=1873484 RepID=A0A1Q5U3L8_9GAMM|nr:hypothetical protein [Xenorhabdus thuongxuanensis]OKP07070.1 hypothetical protein Xentx_01672 [Xenorhabdus thuongxuanensis]
MKANTHMDISLKPADDLFIGQQREFTVTLISDTGIDTDKSITVKKVSKNIKFDQDISNPIKLIYGDKSLTATADLSFTVLKTVGSNPVHDGDEIRFEIDTDAKSSGAIFNSVNFKSKAKAVNNNKMEISINQKADLVIGQSVSFTVTLSSDQLILPDKHVTIKNISKNIKFDQDINNPISLIYTDGYKKASAQLNFTVEDPSGGTVQDGSEIKFEVHTDAATIEGDFNFIGFIGKANEIDLNSLALFVENPILQMQLDGSQKKYTPVHATLKNKNTQKSLKYTPVFITSQQHNKMEEFTFKDAENNNIIVIEKAGPNKGIIITSNENGVIKFNLHLKTSLVSVLNLSTVILSNIINISVAAKKAIYAINYKAPGYLNSIGMPSIEGNTPEGLTAHTTDPNFLTSISSYDGVENGDVVLFFVNGNYSGQFITIIDQKKQLDNYSIALPYAIFKQGETSEFSYTAVKLNGDAFYSEPIPVTYLGGIPYEANQNVSRNYEHCLVHTSIGVGPDNIIPTHNGVAYASIMQYPGHKHNGLFIEIVRSNTQNPALTVNPVPLSVTDFTLNMYIDSPNRNVMLTYYTPITLDNIGSDGNKDSIFFQIPYKDLAGVEYGGLSFDYQFYLDEKLQYGVVWNGSIDTYAAPEGVKNH